MTRTITKLLAALVIVATSCASEITAATTSTTTQPPTSTTAGTTAASRPTTTVETTYSAEELTVPDSVSWTNEQLLQEGGIDGSLINHRGCVGVRTPVGGFIVIIFETDTAPAANTNSGAIDVWDQTLTLGHTVNFAGGTWIGPLPSTITDTCRILVEDDGFAAFRAWPSQQGGDANRCDQIVCNLDG